MEHSPDFLAGVLGIPLIYDIPCVDKKDAEAYLLQHRAFSGSESMKIRGYIDSLNLASDLPAIRNIFCLAFTIYHHKILLMDFLPVADLPDPTAYHTAKDY